MTDSVGSDNKKDPSDLESIQAEKPPVDENVSSPSPKGSPYTGAVAVDDSMKPLSSQPDTAAKGKQHEEEERGDNSMSGYSTSEEGEKEKHHHHNNNHGRPRRQRSSSESSTWSFTSSSGSTTTCHHNHDRHNNHHHRKPLSFSRIFISAAINLVIPFINGVMLGWGEIFANEVGFRWGWIGATVYPRTRSEGKLTLISRNAR